MRVFVGLTPDQSLLAAITAWRNEHQNLPVRWLNDEDLHITLIPPWEEENIPFTTGLINELPTVPPLQFTFHTLELGPRADRANLIWAIGEAPQDLLQFKYTVEGTFQKPHNPRFLLHITIARLEKGKAIKFPSEHISWTGGAQSTALFKSLDFSKYLKLAEK